MVDTPIKDIEKQITEAKDKLSNADLTALEPLKMILKCTACGKIMEIPDDLQALMDDDADISGKIPNCQCGETFGISVTSQ